MQPCFNFLLFSQSCSSDFHIRSSFHFSDLFLKLLLIFLCVSPINAAVEFKVKVVLVEKCDSATIRNDLSDSLNAAKTTLASRGVAPSVNLTFTLETSFCTQTQAAGKIEDILLNSPEDLIVGVAPYQLQTTFSMLAALYDKPYVSANFYTPREARNAFALSLIPSFKQAAAVMEKLLTRFRWQEVSVIASEAGHWEAVAMETHINLAAAGFTMKDLLTLPEDFSQEDAQVILKKVPSSAKGKGVLWCDVVLFCVSLVLLYFFCVPELNW